MITDILGFRIAMATAIADLFAAAMPHESPEQMKVKVRSGPPVFHSSRTCKTRSYPPFT